MTREEIGDYLEKLFDKKDFKRSTRDTYKRWLLKLHDFYSNKKMSDLTFEDIEKYTKQLISRKLASPDSLKQLMFAVNFLYNTELNRNFKFYNIRIPEAKRKEKDYLTQEEVIRLIDFIPHKKQKAIITTIYACFLERKEVLNLKIGDVDSANKIIYVRSDSADPTRECILSDKHLKILRDYFKSLDIKPKVYLFEGQTPGKQYSGTSLLNALKKNVKDCGINKQITPTTLRKSAIKHMVELGVPMLTLLKELNLNDYKTYEIYNKFCYENYKINFSPLDKIVVKPKLHEFDLLDIEELVLDIENEELKDYLKEAVSCLRVGALRAGVIFIWTAGIRLIQQRIINNYPLKEVNKELKIIYPKAKEIKTINDFSFVKDDFIIQLSNRLDMYDKFQKNELISSCLGLRNKCGHPSEYNPQPNKVKAFIEDMITMVFNERK